MTPKQANTLARLLTAAREEIRISSRELARRSGVTNSNVRRLELGEIPNPRPDTLKALAEALDLDLADLYVAVGYTQARGLPSFTPYLRSKYGHLPPEARRELEQSFTDIADRYGYDPDGPKPGQDET